MRTGPSRKWAAPALGGVLAVVIGLAIAGMPGIAQQKGEWPAITGGNTSTRYSALDQINATNFNTIKVAWEWRGEVPGGIEIGDINARGLPIYVDGMLYTTSGPRRTVVAMDPATGKTVWAFQEPATARHDYSMRANHGKGVTYYRLNGRGVIVDRHAGVLRARPRRQDGSAGRQLGRLACRFPASPRPGRWTC